MRNNFEDVRILLRLKNVNRRCPVKERLESSAEHTYGCIILADYFLTKLKQRLNRERVIDLLLYHDLVEIESGDTYFMDEERIEAKQSKEDEGFKILKNKMSEIQRAKYFLLFKEYEEKKTEESQFAHAIDKLEPAVHLLDYKSVWKKEGFTESNLREKKEKYFAPFPEIAKFFNELMDFLKSEKYI